MSTVRVLSRAGAVRGGARHFLQHATIDMDTLATELAVSRATLYRTVGSRDALLADVLCALGDRLVAAVRAPGHPTGPDGVIEITRRYAHGLASATAFQRFARCEPDVAHRVLLSPAGRVHERAVAVQRHLFLQVGGPSPLGDAHDATGDVDPLTERAQVYVGVVESALYAPLLVGRESRFAIAEPALRALLH